MALARLTLFLVRTSETGSLLQKLSQRFFRNSNGTTQSGIGQRLIRHHETSVLLSVNSEILQSLVSSRISMARPRCLEDESRCNLIQRDSKQSSIYFGVMTPTQLPVDRVLNSRMCWQENPHREFDRLSVSGNLNLSYSSRSSQDRTNRLSYTNCKREISDLENGECIEDTVADVRIQEEG